MTFRDEASGMIGEKDTLGCDLVEIGIFFYVKAELHFELGIPF